MSAYRAGQSAAQWLGTAGYAGEVGHARLLVTGTTPASRIIRRNMAGYGFGSLANCV
jgi:ribosomal protein S28E/S33